MTRALRSNSAGKHEGCPIVPFISRYIGACAQSLRKPDHGHCLPTAINEV